MSDESPAVSAIQLEAPLPIDLEWEVESGQADSAVNGLRKNRSTRIAQRRL